MFAEGGVTSPAKDATSFIAGYRQKSETDFLLTELEHIAASGHDVGFEELTGDEVRAAVGEGWAWYNPDEPHGVSKAADESGGWFFSAGVGTDDGWRFGVWFDESGRVKEKDAYYWYD